VSNPPAPQEAAMRQKMEDAMQDGRLLQKVRALIEPVINADGFDLYQFEIKRGKSSFLVRITIDVIDDSGKQRVSIEDCVRVSKIIAPLFNAEDVFQGPFNLEVTSPGVNRKLLRIDHYQRFSGKQVKLKLKSGTVTGVLDGVVNGKVGILTTVGEETKRTEFDYASIIAGTLDEDLTESFKRKRT
jgi:ribosome maturation factor RimP